jgi:predicted amidophosphoribosyltransferase
MTCEHEGCTDEGDPCFLTDDPPDTPSYHFCAEHAFEEGFCPVCGTFWGGIESFDFGPGVCEHCAAEMDEYDADYESEDIFPC